VVQAVIARPFVKWVGGKEKLSGQICDLICRGPVDVYVEPFLGGGAVALALAERIDGAEFVLNDLNKTLIDAWSWVRMLPGSLHRELSRLIDSGLSDERYYEVRANFNGSVGTLRRAAQFLYLNARGYNGLYRENAGGGYNVPPGKRKTNYFPTLVHLQHVSALLVKHGAQLSAKPAVEVIDQVARGLTTKPLIGASQRAKNVVIYADPPYHGTFASYVKGGFNEPDQRELAASLHEAHRRGATVIATNNDTPLIRDIYAWAAITPIEERRAVSCKADGREKAKCVMIVADDREGSS
jgi:DNA adenine methylase